MEGVGGSSPSVSTMKVMQCIFALLFVSVIAFRMLKVVIV